MAPSPPPTLLHQSTGTQLGALPSRLVTEDTPPDMLAGSMDLRVTLPNGRTVKMSVERSTPMMDLLVHITTAHKVSPGGHVLQAMGERGVPLPYKPSTPIGALDTWSISVVPRQQLPQQQNQQAMNKRAPPKPLALQSISQPFEQTFRLQVRLPRNQLFVSRISPRTSLAEILAQVCDDKNLDPAKYELRHPVNTEQKLQLSLTLADYRVTEVALVARGSRASTQLSSSDLPALQSSRSDENHTSGEVRNQPANTGLFGAMLKRSRSGGTTEGSLSGDSLGGRSSSPESLGRSISPPTTMRPPGQTQPPPPPRHRKGRAPKPPPQAAVVSSDNKANATAEDRTPVISHSRTSSDSSGYHEASVLSESPENRVRQPDSPPDTLNREKPAKSHAKQFSRSMTNIPSEASTSYSKQNSLEKLSNAHSMSTTSLATKKKRAPAPPPPRISEMQASPIVEDCVASSSVLEKESTAEREEDSMGEDDIDSAFQSVTAVLEEQIRTEQEQEEKQARLAYEEQMKMEEAEKEQLRLAQEQEEAKLVQEKEEARLGQEREEARLAQEKEELRLMGEQRAALKEKLRIEELLRAEAELERQRIEEERAKLAEEREALAKQRLEQQALEQQLRERLEQELREKQVEQRRDIERLQREQEELERELKEKEQEKADRLKAQQKVEVATPVIDEIVDWQYKLPAPPTAFRDNHVETEMSHPSEDLERRNSTGSTSSTELKNVETKNKLNARMETEEFSDDGEIRPPPPEVVELRVKKSSEESQRSLSPPRVSVAPLRSAHSLYSLVHMEEAEQSKPEPVRKTSSVADVSLSTSDEDDEARLQHLQQQFVQWQQQLINNQSVLQGHVSMPLQSLQVLREILPQMKQKLAEDAINNESSTDPPPRSSTLPRSQRTEISMESLPSITTTTTTTTTMDRRSAPVQRFRPPTVNLGTWSERPKSEVSLKQDSDYRIGVGQHQHTAARAPVVRSAEPKLKDTTNLISAVNRDVVARSNSWRTAPSHNKSSILIQNSTEQVRASNKPTVILRHQPITLQQTQRRYTTLIDVNGDSDSNITPSQIKSNGNAAPSHTNKTSFNITPINSKPTVIVESTYNKPSNNIFTNKSNVNITPAQSTFISNAGTPVSVKTTTTTYQQQRSSITQTSNPVVKGFKISPPPPVVRNVTQKRASIESSEDTRDSLMNAIRSFGGRSNLRKTGSTNNNLVYQS